MGSAGRPRAIYNVIDVIKYVLKRRTAKEGLICAMSEGINKTDVTKCILGDPIR